VTKLDYIKARTEVGLKNSLLQFQLKNGISDMKIVSVNPSKDGWICWFFIKIDEMEAVSERITTRQASGDNRKTE
jgi:hypothetical protein